LDTLPVKRHLTGNGPVAYAHAMKIRIVLQRGLRRFIARDDASGLPPAVVERVRTTVTFLQEMDPPPGSSGTCRASACIGSPATAGARGASR